MVRSFSYAAYAALFLFMHQRTDDVKRYLPWTRAAHTWLSTAFLNGYLAAVKGHDFVPEKKEVFIKGLEPYILEKAFYEIDYEMNNRPDWLRIPLTSVFETLRNNEATTGGARK